MIQHAGLRWLAILGASVVASAEPGTQKLSADQLTSIVAPIALYPDPLLAQVLVASTYPLEVVEVKRWLDQNSQLKGEALANGAKQQQWDASAQALVAFPDVLKKMDENLKWTTDLGNAVLAQEKDVMDAVQTLRVKAQQDGKLQSNEQQKVSTKTVESQRIVEIQPPSTQVIYVPIYNPQFVWGAPVYPYPSTGAVIAASAISFGAGVALGAMFNDSWGWGWGCHWGGEANINVNNNFFRQNNFNAANIQGNGNTWRHDPGHRQGVPYSSTKVANQFGNQTRGQNLEGSGAASRIQQNLGDRPGAGNRGQLGGGARQDGGGGRLGDRSGGVGQPTGALSGRGGQGGIGSDFGARSGGDGAFSGLDRGSAARDHANRGFSSMGGGGGRGGFGGGRGGGRRR